MANTRGWDARINSTTGATPQALTNDHESSVGVPGGPTMSRATVRPKAIHCCVLSVFMPSSRLGAQWPGFSVKPFSLRASTDDDALGFGYRPKRDGRRPRRGPL